MQILCSSYSPKKNFLHRSTQISRSFRRGHHYISKAILESLPYDNDEAFNAAIASIAEYNALEPKHCRGIGLLGCRLDSALTLDKCDASIIAPGYRGYLVLCLDRRIRALDAILFACWHEWKCLVQTLCTYLHPHLAELVISRVVAPIMATDIFEGLENKCEIIGVLLQRVPNSNRVFKDLKSLPGLPVAAVKRYKSIIVNDLSHQARERLLVAALMLRQNSVLQRLPQEIVIHILAQSLIPEAASSEHEAISILRRMQWHMSSSSRTQSQYPALEPKKWELTKQKENAQPRFEVPAFYLPVLVLLFCLFFTAFQHVLL